MTSDSNSRNPEIRGEHVHSSPFNPQRDDSQETDRASDDQFDEHGGVSKLTIAMWVMISLIVVISATWMLVSYLRGDLIIG